MKKGIIILFVAVMGIACNKEEDNYKTVDNENIVNYLIFNNIEAYEFTSGLFYSIDEEGYPKEYPNINSTLLMKYTAKLANDTIFNSSEGEFVEVRLRDCIEGLQMGMQLFEKGSKGKLFIPSSLGYGEYEMPNIPANSVLIYEFEVKDFFNF